MWILLRIFGLAAITVICHALTLNTPYGYARLELPFFLAVVLSASNRQFNGTRVLFVSWLYDFLDSNYVSTPAHIIIYLIGTRFRRMAPLYKFPVSVIYGFGVLLIDRILYGMLYGLHLDMTLRYTFSDLSNIAYYMTLLAVPLGMRYFSDSPEQIR